MVRTMLVVGSSSCWLFSPLIAYGFITQVMSFIIMSTLFHDDIFQLFQFHTFHYFLFFSVLLLWTNISSAYYIGCLLSTSVF